MDHKIDPELIRKYLETDPSSFKYPTIPARPLHKEPKFEGNTNASGDLSRVKLGVSTDGFDEYTSSRVKSLENLIAAMIIHGGINPDNLECEALDIGTGGGEGLRC